MGGRMVRLGREGWHWGKESLQVRPAGWRTQGMSPLVRTPSIEKVSCWKPQTPWQGVIFYRPLRLWCKGCHQENHM